MEELNYVVLIRIVLPLKYMHVVILLKPGVIL